MKPLRQFLEEMDRTVLELIPLIPPKSPAQAIAGGISKALRSRLDGLNSRSRKTETVRKDFFKVCENCSVYFYRKYTTSGKRWEVQTFCSPACWRAKQVGLEADWRTTETKICSVCELPFGPDEKITPKRWLKLETCGTRCAAIRRRQSGAQMVLIHRSIPGARARWLRESSTSCGERKVPIPLEVMAKRAGLLPETLRDIEAGVSGRKGWREPLALALGVKLELLSLEATPEKKWWRIMEKAGLTSPVEIPLAPQPTSSNKQ
jgi:hypothetical protein